MSARAASPPICSDIAPVLGLCLLMSIYYTDIMFWGIFSYHNSISPTMSSSHSPPNILLLPKAGISIQYLVFGFHTLNYFNMIISSYTHIPASYNEFVRFYRFTKFHFIIYFFTFFIHSTVD